MPGQDRSRARRGGAQRRVEPDRGQGRHVERVADAETTATDVALPAEPATIEVVRRQADQRGDLLAADLAEFGQQVLFMSNLPLESNVQFVTIMATKMPFVGRG